MYVVRCFFFIFWRVAAYYLSLAFISFVFVWMFDGYMDMACTSHANNKNASLLYSFLYIYIVISSILLNNKYQTYEQNKNNQNDKAKLCCMNFFLIWGAKGLKHAYVDGSYSDLGLCHSGNDGYELYMLPTPLSWPSHHNGITTKKPANHIQLAHKHKA